MLHWLTERRRHHLLEQPFPDAWRAILDRDVGAYRWVDADEQQRLRDLVQVFVAEKHWEGAGGLELTDEIRVTVAGTGCQMLVNRDHDLFADVLSIVVYPSAVVVPENARSFWDPGLAVAKGDTPVIGLAGRGDALVLAWDAALRGARDQRDGSNVVIHELAHKIDFLDGSADGTPPLAGREARRAWASAFEPAFLRHRERAARGERSLLSDYAITNEAEYFAVATEMFFEKPRALADELPEVYAQLRDFFRLDLAARVTDRAASRSR
ncbi:MAG TPA: M90 family metallopeptidase [Kofleriaceae bacterium]|nr:M90 family metallopeptidase [Kofleriaceae bacterium]